MIYKIGTVDDTQKVVFDSDTAKQIVCFHADVLTSEYGADRNIDTDDGGYILYVTKGTPAQEIKASFDYTKHLAELVHLQNGVYSAIYIINNDYVVVIISDASDTPPEIIKEYEKQMED